MWLFNSSIGRKLVMSLSGLFLILFLTFHLAMNFVAVFSGEAYNMVCEFLGANWYALVGTLILALGFVVHIIYAFWLTIQNRKARGNDRYAVVAKPKQVEWASQNMLVLGIIGLDLGVDPHDGYQLILDTFSNPLFVILYLVWFVAIWFHLTHGFWSAIQTIGWNNNVWLTRWKAISNVYATIICAGFAFIAIYFGFIA